MLAGGSDERDMITIPPVDHDDHEAPQFVSRAQLVRIIKPRVEEILEMVRDRLAASPFAAEPRGRVVLTGGACQLTGLAELATQILGRPVRIGRPLGIAGLPEEAKGPAFAAATGLLVYPQAAHLEHFEPRRTRHASDRNGRLLSHGSDDGFARASDDPRRRTDSIGRWRTGATGGVELRRSAQ